MHVRYNNNNSKDFDTLFLIDLTGVLCHTQEHITYTTATSITVRLKLSQREMTLHAQELGDFDNQSNAQGN